MAELALTLIAVLGVPLVLAILFIFLCTKRVSTSTIGVIEKFGKFQRVAQPGLNLYAWPVEQYAGTLSMRINQIDNVTLTKTKDNVTVQIKTAVQYHAMNDEVFNAFYKLSNLERQVQAYVDDVVRASIPKMDLDEAFEAKDQVADEVRKNLAATMEDYGYNIVKALVTDIAPDQSVVKAMNEINTARRQRMAAQEKAEAEKILKVKIAEAEAEAAYLAGTGIARQRVAIVDGMKSSVNHFNSGVEGSSTESIMNMILTTQYMDMIKELSQGTQSKVVFVPHGPGGLSDMQNQIAQGLQTQGNVV